MCPIDDEQEKKEDKERFSSVKTYVSLGSSITPTMFPSPSRPKSVGDSFYKYNANTTHMQHKYYENTTQNK